MLFPCQCPNDEGRKILVHGEVNSPGVFGGIMVSSARVTAWLTLRRKDKNPPRLGYR
jgi:hypothetical protein